MRGKADSGIFNIRGRHFHFRGRESLCGGLSRTRGSEKSELLKKRERLRHKRAGQRVFVLPFWKVVKEGSGGVF